MSNGQPDFRVIQQGFANHIKTPDTVVRPADVDDRYMAIYRDLFFKNVMGFLSGGFPVLAEIIGEQRWQGIGREFFSSHQSKTPYFLEISREFLSFLEHEYKLTEHDPAYMLELAHYEWLELFVDVEACDDANFVDGDILTSIPVMSPVVEGFLYQYPVHKISITNAAPDPEPSALVVYRDRNDEVGFAQTNPFTLQLLALLKEGGRSAEEALLLLLTQSGLAENKAALEGGINTLRHWQQLGIIWGCEAKTTN